MAVFRIFRFGTQFFLSVEIAKVLQAYDFVHNSPGKGTREHLEHREKYIRGKE